VRFEAAQGPCQLDAVLLEIDKNTGKTVSIESIQIKDVAENR